MEMDFRFLFDPQRKLFSIGFSEAADRLDDGLYDLLASEARLASFVAIAKGDVPVEHWFRLGRTLTATSGATAMVSWSGSMFEYLMPLLVMESFPFTLLDQTYHGAVRRQEAYGRERGAPWGVSESAYNLRDRDGTYQYRAFGVPDLALRRGLSKDLVIAPYASVLALEVDPHRAMRNLAALERRGALGPFGFRDALDYTRPAPDGHPAVVGNYMAHHIGMGLVALANALCTRVWRHRFHADSLVRSAELVLFERVPRRFVMAQAQPSEPDAGRTPREIAKPAVRQIDEPDTPQPRVALLGTAPYTVLLTNAGGGYSRYADLAVTRWRADGTRDCYGQWCYLRDVESGRVWSATYQPTLAAPDTYRATFATDRVTYTRRDGPLETRAEIAVASDDGAEVRRVTVINRSAHTREVELTSYGEIVLQPPDADRAHPAFGNLFVETEWAEAHGAILASRRPRSAEGERIWCVHVAAVDGRLTRPITCETDRARFVGRGRTTQNPAALDAAGPLSGTVGAVLDPIFALRVPVRIRPGRTARVTFTTLVAPDRERALELADRYRQEYTAQRALDLAWTHAQVELRDLMVSPADAALYQQLAGHLLFSHPAMRPPQSELARNRRGQDELWTMGLSGDWPILLATVDTEAGLPSARLLLRAHHYWRTKGVNVDLVLLNTRPHGYLQELNDHLLATVMASSEAGVMDRPGGVFIRRTDLLSPEQMLLLRSVARVHVRCDGLGLGDLLDLPEPDTPLPAPFRPSEPREGYRRHEAEIAPEETLTFDNGHRWTEPVRAVRDPPAGGGAPPRPVGERDRERRRGLLRHGKWRRLRLGGEQLFLSADPLAQRPGERPPGRRSVPAQRGDRRRVERHARSHPAAIPVHRAARRGIERVGALARRDRLPSHRERRARAGRQDLDSDAHQPRRRPAHPHPHQLRGVDAGGAARAHAAPGPHRVGPGHGRDPGAELLRSALRIAGRVLLAQRAAHRLDGGPPGIPGKEREHGRASGARPPWPRGDGGAGLRSLRRPAVHAHARPGETREIVHLLGAAPGEDAAREAIRALAPAGAARTAQDTSVAEWRERLSTIRVRTPSPAVDAMLNRWALYQALGCRMWARSALYQSSGAYGFRDQLQDSLAFLYAEPGVAREHIVRAAGRQFLEGDVQHWWHPQSGRGVRTRFSDDLVWLPFSVDRYVEVTGDLGVLDEATHFLSMPELQPGQEEVYDLPQISPQTGTVYEHCVRALRRATTTGPHGLPLIGGGDWNDGMNRVGIEGRGESVWLAWFLIATLRRFAGRCDARGDRDTAREFRDRADAYAAAAETAAWDGAWYRRAYFDDGAPLGSRESDECRIDAIAQSWSVISGAAEPERARRAMRSLDEHLVRQDARLIMLLTPPFDRTPHDPGYIKGYLPGVRENGAQYTHAALWSVLATAMQGEGDRAMELFEMLNPFTHAATPEGVDTYKVEPYAVCADVYTAAGHLGRGGWTWYTGSASWMYRVGLEAILGFGKQGDTLRIDPCIPREWREFGIEYRHGSSTYEVTVRNPSGVSRGVERVVMDGEALDDGRIPLVDDGRRRCVEVTLGGASAG